MLELLVLEPVIQYYGVATKTVYGIAAGLDTVAVHNDGDAWQVRRKHVGLVTASRGVKQYVLAVRNHERRVDDLREHSLPPRSLLAAVAAREYGDFAPLGSESSGEYLGYRRLAGSSGSDVADRNHLYAQRESANET